MVSGVDTLQYIILGIVGHTNDKNSVDAAGKIDCKMPQFGDQHCSSGQEIILTLDDVSSEQQGSAIEYDRHLPSNLRSRR